MPEFRAVYFANGNDVHTVIVDGRIVLRDRKALLVDEDAMLRRRPPGGRPDSIDRLGLRDLLKTPDTFWQACPRHRPDPPPLHPAIRKRGASICHP